MTIIRELDTATAVFNKPMKAIVIPFGYTEPFPHVVKLRSHKSNRVIECLFDTQASERNEGWDGEMAEYRPMEEAGFKTLVLTRE